LHLTTAAKMSTTINGTSVRTETHCTPTQQEVQQAQHLQRSAIKRSRYNHKQIIAISVVYCVTLPRIELLLFLNDKGLQHCPLNRSVLINI
jgi:hypothetical protein